MRNELDRLKQIQAAGRTAFLEVPLGTVALREEEDGATRSEIQVFVAGDRVHPYFGKFSFDAKFRRALVDEFSEAGVARPIDVNHASMFSFDYDSGKAYGWVEKLHDRGTDGVFATVRWTDAGVKAVRSGEYAYISPEFSLDAVDKTTGEKTGRPKLFAAALTNRPFLEGMEAVAAAEPLANHNTEVLMDPIKKGPDGGADGGNVVDMSEKIRSLEAENVKLKARAEADAATLQSIEEGKKSDAIGLAEKEGRVVPANLEAIKRLSAVSTVDELKVYLGGLPVQIHKTEPAGAAQPGPGRESGVGLSEDDKEMLSRIGVAESTVEKYGRVKAVRLDGKAVLDNGKVIPMADLNAGRA